MRKILLSTALLSVFVGAFAQEYLLKNEYFYSLPNKLSLLVLEDGQATDVTIGITFYCGSFLEDDDFDGLSFLYEKILNAQVKKHLKSSMQQYAADSLLFSIYSSTSYEYVFLRVTFPEKY